MKKRLFLASVLAAMGVGAFAQLNAPEHVDIYAGTYKDSQHERAWVHFTSNNPRQLERRSIFFTDDEYQLQAFRCGALTPDGYMGYMTRVYTYEEYPLCFYKLDVNTGQYQWILDMTDNNVYGPNWPMIYDVDYDWSRGVLYALGYEATSNGGYSSALYTVNTKTGRYTKFIDNIGFYATSMAIDYDGNFYFLRFETIDGENISGTHFEKMQLGADNRMTRVFDKSLTINGDAFPLYYLNDLTVDHTTGDLYWAADDHENWQRLVRINPETAETTYIGRIGWYESVVGMHIPFNTASSRTAPAHATDFRISYADRGSSVTLGWQNPTTQWNRSELSDLSSVSVARDSESNIIGTVSATGQEGQRMQFTDTEASKGLHTYYVIPTNGSGAGVPNSYLAWAGEDTPGKVSSLGIEKNDDNTLTVSWSLPTIGAHDGWFDNSALTYNVTRQPDGKKVAQGISTTSFTDTELGKYDNYYYEVAAVSAEGSGTVATSSAVHAGNAIPAPYDAVFTTKEEADAWTVLDANYDGKAWEWQGENGLADMLRMNLNSEATDNDLLVSPKLYVEEGKTYRVAANILMDLPNTYRIQLAESAEPVAEKFRSFESYNFTIDELDPSYVSHTLEGTFEADHTGGHFVAVRSQSPAAPSNIGVYRVTFEEVPEYDLGLVAVDVVPDGIEGKEMAATITVANRGLKTFKKGEYRLEAFDVETGAVLGSVDGPYSVYIDSQEDIVLPFTPGAKIAPDALSPQTKEKIAFRIVSEKDGNVRNNTSETYNFNVAQAGTSEWNVDITEGDLRGDYADYETRVPFDFTFFNSNFQSIYDYSLIGMEGTITRIGYRYERINDFSGTMFVTLDLGTSNSVYYNSVYDAVPDSKLTNVFYAPVKLDPSDGEHVLAFDLETPFPISKGQNLVVNISREGNIGNMYPIMMKSFNHGTGIYGSVRACSDKSVPALTTGECVPYIPCIMLSIATSDGVKTVELAPNNATPVAYDLFGRPATQDQNVIISDGKKTIK